MGCRVRSCAGVLAAVVELGCADEEPTSGAPVDVVSLSVDGDGAAYVVTMSSESWSGPGYGYRCTTSVVRFDTHGDAEPTDIRTPADHFECRAAFVFSRGASIYFAGGNSVGMQGGAPSMSYGALLAHATSIAVDPSSSPVVTWAEFSRTSTPPYPPRVTRYDSTLTVVAEHELAEGTLPLAVATSDLGDVAVVTERTLTMLDVDLLPRWRATLAAAAADVHFAGDGKVVVAGGGLGSGGEPLAAARWTGTGDLDPSFDASGVELAAEQVVVDAADDVYLAGTVHLDGHDATRVVATDPAGTPRWTVDLPVTRARASLASGEAPDGFTETFLQLSPDGDLLVLAWRSSSLIRIDRDGTVLWRAALEP